MGGIVAGTFGVGILAIGTVGVIGVPVAETHSPRFTSSGGLIPVNPGSVNDICPKQTANCTKCKQPKQSVHADIFFSRPMPHSSRQVVHHAFGWLFLLCSFCSFRRHRDGSLDCVLVLCQIVFCCPSSARFITSLR